VFYFYLLHVSPAMLTLDTDTVILSVTLQDCIKTAYLSSYFLQRMVDQSVKFSHY